MPAAPAHDRGARHEWNRHSRAIATKAEACALAGARRRPAAPSVVDAANDALRELPTALGLWNRSQLMHARLRRAAAGIARDRVRLAEAAARAS